MTAKQIVEMLPRADHLIYNDDLTDRRDWLQARGKGLGGSDIVRVLNDPWTLWREKTGRAEGFQGNRMTALGTALEPHILARWAEEAGATLFRPVPFLIDSIQPWRRASLDAIARLPDGTLVVVDAKYSTLDWKGHVTLAAYLQMIWYLAITGLQVGIVVKMDARGNLEEYRIEFNAEEFASYQDAASTFWNDHVLEDVPPEPSDGERGEKALYEMAGRSLVPKMDATDIMLAVEAELTRVDQTLQAAEARAKELRGRIAEQMAIHGVKRIDFPDGSRWTYVEKTGSPRWKEYALSLGGSEATAKTEYQGKPSSYVTATHATPTEETLYE